MAARIKHHWVTLRSKLAPWGWQQLQDQPFHWRRNHFSTLAARVGPVQERSCRCSTLASQIKWARIWNKHVAKTMVVNFRFQCCWIKLGSKRSICRAKLVNPLCKLQHVNLDKVAKWTNVDEIWTCKHQPCLSGILWGEVFIRSTVQQDFARVPGSWSLPVVETRLLKQEHMLAIWILF